MEPQQPMTFQVPTQSADDKRKKLYILLIILFGVGLLLFMGSLAFNRDDPNAVLQNVIIYHQEELRISKDARSYSDEFEFDQVQANINVLVESDRVSLQTFFQSELNEETVLLLTDGEAKSRFETAESTNSFIDEYKETMSELITKNITGMKRLDGLTTDQDLKFVLNRSISNHESLLEQVNSL